MNNTRISAIFSFAALLSFSGFCLAQDSHGLQVETGQLDQAAAEQKNLSEPSAQPAIDTAPPERKSDDNLLSDLKIYPSI